MAPETSAVTESRKKLLRCEVARRRWIVERDEEFDGHDHCLMMWPDGTVRYYQDPAAVAAAIRRSDKRLADEADRSGRALVVVSTIEWRDGLRPPVTK